MFVIVMNEHITTCCHLLVCSILIYILLIGNYFSLSYSVCLQLIASRFLLHYNHFQISFCFRVGNCCLMIEINFGNMPADN